MAPSSDATHTPLEKLQGYPHTNPPPTRSASKPKHAAALLGTGVSADVYKRTKRGRLYVVKVYRRYELEPRSEYRQRARYEYDVIRKFLHPNVTTVSRFKVGVFCGSVSLWFPGDGTVDLWKVYKREKRFEPREARCFWRQMCAGVAYLHAQGWSHRDVKPENCVLDPSGRVKLIDFATASPIGRPAYGLVGSRRYAAPETWLQILYDGAAADVWALGVVLHWMVFGTFPWAEAVHSDKGFETYRQNWKPVENEATSHSDIDSGAGRGAWLLLVPDPSQRPTLASLASQPWFKRMAFCLGTPLLAHCGTDHRLLVQRCLVAE